MRITAVGVSTSCTKCKDSKPNPFLTGEPLTTAHRLRDAVEFVDDGREQQLCVDHFREGYGHIAEDMLRLIRSDPLANMTGMRTMDLDLIQA